MLPCRPAASPRQAFDTRSLMTVRSRRDVAGRANIHGAVPFIVASTACSRNRAQAHQ
jgi:hypothetical protein